MISTQFIFTILSCEAGPDLEYLEFKDLNILLIFNSFSFIVNDFMLFYYLDNFSISEDHTFGFAFYMHVLVQCISIS